MSNRLGFNELAEKVVKTKMCTGCGACVTVCPFNDILDYVDENPLLIGECNNCGICPRVCPRYHVEVDELDEFVSGRKRRGDEAWGTYKSLCVARSLNNEILERAQDGGVATSLLSTAMELGVIDGAIVSSINRGIPWLPMPQIASNRDEIVNSAGTRYSYSPNILVLKQAIENGLKKIAFIGTPCQILAIRRMQKANLKKLTRPLVFTIGLFCSESFSYHGLMVEKIRGDLGIDLRNITKINIKGGLRVFLKEGEMVKIPLKEAKEYAQSMCKHCHDFSAELADISLGGVGLDKWSLVIIRTNEGEEVFEKAVRDNAIEVGDIEEFPRSLRLLKRLSTAKASRK